MTTNTKKTSTVTMTAYNTENTPTIEEYDRKVTLHGYRCGDCGNNEFYANHSPYIVRLKGKSKCFSILTVCTVCRSKYLTRSCPECETVDLFFDDKRRDTSCKKCGLVL